MSKSNDYTTDNLLDIEYFSKHSKLIAIDLGQQIELENLDLKQQINFTGRLKRNGGATGMEVQKCSLLLRKKKKPLLISHKIL